MTMPDAKAAWDEVGNRFADIAGHVKEQFDARAAFGAPDSQKVDDAVRTLVGALDNAFTAIGDTLRDPATRDEVKQAANAMGNALATTFTDVADQIRTFTGRAGGPSGGPGGEGPGDATDRDGGGYATPG
jgi:Flp pilus assembly pilin Flp